MYKTLEEIGDKLPSSTGDRRISSTNSMVWVIFMGVLLVVLPLVRFEVTMFITVLGLGCQRAQGLGPLSWGKMWYVATTNSPKNIFFAIEKKAGWWCFKYFLLSSLFGEMIQFDEHIFQMGWFNHQLEGKKPKTSSPINRLSDVLLLVLGEGTLW